MTTYHVNSNGEVKPCKATKNRCQFGDESLHFGTISAANDFISSVQASGNGRLLRGKKSNAQELLREKAALTRVARPRATTAVIIPVPDAVASWNWEVAGIFRPNVSFACGACSYVNHRTQTHVVRTGSPKGHIAASCTHCAKRNVFAMRNRANKVGWLVESID